MPGSSARVTGVARGRLQGRLGLPGVVIRTPGVARGCLPDSLGFPGVVIGTSGVCQGLSARDAEVARHRVATVTLWSKGLKILAQTQSL